MSTEHTPPSAERIASAVVGHHNIWGDEQWSIACDVVAALRASGLLPSDTPSAALDFTDVHVVEWAHSQIELELTAFLSDEEWDTAEIAARMIGRLQGVIGGPVPSFALGGLVAGSDDSTDTLIDRLTAEHGCIHIEGVHYEGGKLGYMVSTLDEQCFDAPGEPSAALRAALASQPEPETKEE